MKIQYILLILLLPLATALNISNQNPLQFDIKLERFNDTKLETKYFMIEFQDKNLTYTSDECKDVCFNFTAFETTKTFNYFVFAMFGMFLFNVCALAFYTFNKKDLAVKVFLWCGILLFILGCINLIL